jgi:hypothetical protein
MRLCYLLFIGIALMSSGCATPTVMGVSGEDWVPLGTREQVHDALGTPTKIEIGDGNAYEEFQIRGGCDQIVMGSRVPAFQPLPEFHIRGWGELQLIKVDDVGSIPAKGNNSIVVASINNALYFRIFDDAGRTIADTDESKLVSKSRLIAQLKKQLESAWPPRRLSVEEKHRIIAAVVSIVGRYPQGSFEVGVGTVKAYGLVQIATLPTVPDQNRQRVVPGQTLRFDFDHLGNVRKVFADGELLFSLASKPDPLALVNEQR